MFSAKVIKDSISPDNVRLLTFEIIYPRFIHSEFMTHRSISKNSSSSRATPSKKTIEAVKNNPAMPIWWGRNQAGMSAIEELNEPEILLAKKEWLNARDNAVKSAEILNALGLHKQITNRLLEPFMWHTVICSMTERSNMYALRSHKDAQPEFKLLSDLMQEAEKISTPKFLNYGEWHLPLTTDEEIEASKQDGTYNIENWKRISTGRIARTSYLTHFGTRDLQADIELCDKLKISGHMSPLEQCATPLSKEECNNKNPAEVFIGNFRGWKQFRKEIPNEYDFSLINKE